MFEDEAGFSMTPPQAKTWSQHDRAPVVRGRGRSRLICRPRRDDGRSDGRKSFFWRDYRDLLTAAHQQLGGPIVLIWDNLNVHKAAGLREFAASRDWLTSTTCRLTRPAPTPSRASGHCCDVAGSPTSPSPRRNTSCNASDAVYATSSTAATS